MSLARESHTHLEKWGRSGGGVDIHCFSHCLLITAKGAYGHVSLTSFSLCCRVLTCLLCPSATPRSNPKWRRRRWMNNQGKKRIRRRTATRCNTQQELESMWVRKPKARGRTEENGSREEGTSSPSATRATIPKTNQNHHQGRVNGKWSSLRTYWGHGSKPSSKQQDKGRRPWDCCGGKGHRMWAK